MNITVYFAHNKTYISLLFCNIHEQINYDDRYEYLVIKIYHELILCRLHSNHKKDKE